jgi:hypothetical protein
MNVKKKIGEQVIQQKNSKIHVHAEFNNVSIMLSIRTYPG